ncbi:hypothetical protein WMF11_44305 [Sorangium sp. So ce295]|uniref:hypothetical protein n=1 Tax=Sorangium sp. So ce295 TaxID=3133295 RepID=UPI003F5E3B87
MATRPPARVPAPDGRLARAVMRLLLRCLPLLLLWPCARPASALAAAPGAWSDEEEEAVFDVPAPPTLPGLTLRDPTFTFEYTAAVIEPDAASRAGGRLAFAWYSHGEMEVPLVPRKWFVGAVHDSAAASVPGVERSILLGSPELYGRGVWSSVRGLASGGGFGVVLPVPRDVSRDQAEVLRTARVVRPWDETRFRELTLTFRPWFDMRHITGPFIFQLRQGLDWSLVVRGRRSGERRTDITAHTAFYFGYRLARPVGVGLELWEVYQLTQDLPDDRRATFAVSPSVRFILSNVQPALSVLLPVTTPLRGDVASYYAARFSVGFTFPTGAPRARR